MEETQLLQSILNSVSEGVMTLDQNWKILTWNSAAERITGFHREEVVGQKCKKILRSPLCRKHCPVDKALARGRPYQDVPVTILNTRNEVLHLLVNAAPLYDENGQIIGGLETFRDVSDSYWMREELHQQYDFENIIGQSEAMQRVFDAVGSLIHTDTSVLIQGESGTGKELIARALHFHGPRRHKSFVAINCSALPENLLESELFGFVRGAFTGATQTRVGKFEMANGGTLFLDEIAEISQAVQVKLLRVLEEREFQRLGENKSVKIDVRLITATNKNLFKDVLDGSFREDLYYRLSVYPLDLPPLRDRNEDIPLLLDHFIDKFNKQMGRKIQGITQGVLDILERYHWPGNIREFANAVEYAFVHSKSLLIHPEDLPQGILLSPEANLPKRGSRADETLDLVEKELILRELEESNWKKNLVAKRLGMSRSTLWRKMTKYGITEPLKR
jgi:PAS domain S-box-containing protein